MRREVTFVVTHGRGSLDLYSRELGARLPVPQLHTNLFQRAADTFSAPTLSGHAARGTLVDARLLRLLRAAGGPLHLPSHHFGRYARFVSAPYVITVHDVIRLLDLERDEPLIERPTFRGRMLLGLDTAGIRRARAIVAVSAFTKGEIVRRLGIEPGRIFVVLNGVDHEVFRPVDRRPLEEPYVVFLGTEQPRKNLATLLRAFARLKREPRFRSLKLVKAGASADVTSPFRAKTLRVVDALGLRGEVLFTERLERSEFAAYLSGAECLVLPSLYEGFGLPILEAMACGCPVVVSNVTALPEVAADAGFLVDPLDPRAIADAVASILDDVRLREDLRQRGLARAASFSWDRAAEETLRVYDRVF